jgi:hypothetical protein
MENVYEKLKRMVEAMGLKGIENYYTDPASQEQQSPQQPDPMAEEQAKAQVEIEKVRIKAAADVEIAKIKAEADLMIAGLRAPPELNAADEQESAPEAAQEPQEEQPQEEPIHEPSYVLGALHGAAAASPDEPPPQDMGQ